jgi:hypothetical protein
MQLDQHYVLKPGSIGRPSQYLGAEVGEYRLPNDPTRVRWYSSSDKYVKEAVRNVSNWMEDRGKILRPKVQTILPSGYRPELDATPYCNDEEADYFQQQIGVLRWAVELGRIDLTAATSMMASYTAAPRTGFSYLKCHDRSKLVFDDSYVQVNDEQDYDWKGFYPNVTEEIPANIPKPRGKAMQMTVFVDTDHAGDVLTRRSRTGVLVYLNRSPILWYSKKQNSV